MILIRYLIFLVASIFIIFYLSPGLDLFISQASSTSLPAPSFGKGTLVVSQTVNIDTHLAGTTNQKIMGPKKLAIEDSFESVNIPKSSTSATGSEDNGSSTDLVLKQLPLVRPTDGGENGISTSQEGGLSTGDDFGGNRTMELIPFI